MSRARKILHDVFIQYSKDDTSNVLAVYFAKCFWFGAVSSSMRLRHLFSLTWTVGDMPLEARNFAAASL